jgi:hypothetical protein
MNSMLDEICVVVPPPTTVAQGPITTSPYYVHPNDNRAISLITKQLASSNYHT